MQRLLASIGLLLTCLPTAAALAQTGTTVPTEPPRELTTVISGPSDVAVGRTVVLDASDSLGVDQDTQYRWYRVGVSQPISETIEAVYTPLEPGDTTIRLELTDTLEDGTVIRSEAEHLITVYERKIVLIADATVPREKIENHRQQASQEGVFLRVLQPGEPSIPIGDEGSLRSLIVEGESAMAGAETLILWTEGISGLQALLRALEGDTTRLQALQNQTIVMISNRSLASLARTIQGPFSVLSPDRIIITRKEAITPLLTAGSVEGFLERIDQWDLDFLVVDETSFAVRPWNLLSSLVVFMLTHGVPSQTLIFLLTLPVIATILAFLKQVVGITTFGLYTPSIIALSFLALGWTVGVSFLLFILITGYATRAFMRRWRLLYIPKVAIILTVVSLTLLVLLGIGAYFNLTLSGDTIFILLIMSTLSESFLNAKTEQGWTGAVLGIGETILAALLCVFIVQWSVLQSVILAYPELILLTFLINIVLGRWTGLRLVEYFRFREVFKHIQEE